jgi:hypothetical protein
MGYNMRETGIPDNLGGRLTHGRHVERAPVEAPRPAEEQDGGKPDKPEAGTDPLSRLDADDVKTWREQLKAGTFTPEELQRLQALSDAELEAIANPPKPPSKASVERELAEISALRKADSRAYWKDEPLQQRERELLGMLEELKAAPAQAEGDDAAAEKAEPADELAQTQARLKEIRDARRANPRSVTEKMEAEELALIDRREILETGAQAMPAELIEAWRLQGGLKFNMERARTAAEAMLADVGEGRDDLMQSIDSLPPGALSALYSHLALDAPTTARPASAAALEQFRNMGDETSALVAAWGKDAARRLGAAQSRFGAMLQTMSSPADQQAARDWLDSLSASQQAAVARALAG